MLKKLLGLSMGIALISNSAGATEILSPNELHGGMVGKAYTTTTGDEMTSFNVEIIGVVPAGKGAPPQILARAYGGIIPNTNGVIHGMSGSPVYVNGKLIGAIARGVGNDVLPYKFYITPITAMEKILDYPDPMAKVNKIGVEEVKVLPPAEAAVQAKKDQEEFEQSIAMTLGKDVKDIFNKEDVPDAKASLEALKEGKPIATGTSGLDKLESNLHKLIKMVEKAILGTTDEGENSKAITASQDGKTTEQDSAKSKDHKDNKDKKDKKADKAEAKAEGKAENCDLATTLDREEPVKVTDFNIAISTPLDMRGENHYNGGGEDSQEENQPEACSDADKTKAKDQQQEDQGEQTENKSEESNQNTDQGDAPEKDSTPTGYGSPDEGLDAAKVAAKLKDAEASADGEKDQTKEASKSKTNKQDAKKTKATKDKKSVAGATAKGTDTKTADGNAPTEGTKAKPEAGKAATEAKGEKDGDKGATTDQQDGNNSQAKEEKQAPQQDALGNKPLIPDAIETDDNTNGDTKTGHEVTKKDESKPVPVITPAMLDKELAKEAQAKQLEKMVVSASALSKYKFDRSLNNVHPLFTSNGVKHSFIIGFTPAGENFLRKLIGAKAQDFAGNGGAEYATGSDVDLNYPLKPGDPMGATVAYGDFSIGATGTVTQVDGNKVLSFGHPMFFKGNVNYFMNSAKVIDSAGGILDGVQVASIGKIIGRINQDRYAGISGILNSYPASVPVRVKVIDIDRQKVMNYGVKIAYDEDNIVPLAPAIVYGAMSRTADRELYGTAQIGFAIANNVSPDGVFRRSNMYYDPVDVGENTVTELSDALADLVGNKEKVSNIYDINVEVRLSSKRRTATITSVTADKMDVRPGDIVTFSITLQPYRAGERIITVPYLIPRDQPKGPMTFEVKGGGFIRVTELMKDDSNLTMAKDGDDAEETTLDKLDKIADQGRNNEIIINPIVDVFNQGDMDKAVDAAFKLSQAMEKMTPAEREAMARSREVIHKTKYVVDNVRHITLNVLKKR